jgi:hypothetical protein
MLLFFSMISQGVAYFISLGREVMFRLNWCKEVDFYGKERKKY